MSSYSQFWPSLVIYKQIRLIKFKYDKYVQYDPIWSIMAQYIQFCLNVTNYGLLYPCMSEMAKLISVWVIIAQYGQAYQLCPCMVRITKYSQGKYSQVKQVRTGVACKAKYGQNNLIWLSMINYYHMWRNIFNYVSIPPNISNYDPVWPIMAK